MFLSRAFVCSCLVTLLALARPNVAAAQPVKVEGTQPFSLGITDKLHSGILGEDRTLNIYLPDDFNLSDTAHYSVIYLLDGSADEDYIHVAGLVQFSSFPWVGWLHNTILVGIANVDRRRDFTYPSTIPGDKKLCPTSGGSAKFISFINDELKPYIVHKYHATGSSTLIGESLGGLLASEMLLKDLSSFDNYIIISPSLWWDNGSLLNAKQKWPDKSVNVFIAVGKEGLTPSDSPHVMEVDANLLAEKVKENKAATVYLDYLPAETHATIGHQAILDAFRARAPKK